MHNRTDRGWVRAGLAVLVTGLLGGGVLAVVGGPMRSRQVTADGIATGQAAGAQALEPAAPQETPAGRATPEVGDKVMMGDDGGSVTVAAVEDGVSAGRLFGAGEGFKYVAAEVKGCSGPHEKNITFEPTYFLLRLDDGTIRDTGVGAKKPSLEGGTIPPGKCLSGWVTFTVPEGALPTGVIYDGSTRTTWTVPIPENAKQTTTTTGDEPRASTSSSTATTSKPKASSSKESDTKKSDTKKSDTKKSDTKKSSTKASSTTTTSSKRRATTSTTGSTKATGKTTTTTGSEASGSKASSTTTTGSKPTSTTTTEPSPSGTTSSTRSTTTTADEG